MMQCYSRGLTACQRALVGHLPNDRMLVTHTHILANTELHQRQFRKGLNRTTSSYSCVHVRWRRFQTMTSWGDGSSRTRCACCGSCTRRKDRTKSGMMPPATTRQGQHSSGDLHLSCSALAMMSADTFDWFVFWLGHDFLDKQETNRKST